MTENQIEMARKFYDRMMVSVEDLANCEEIAARCVDAAQQIDLAIMDEEIEEQLAAQREFEAEQEAKKEQKEQLKAKREETMKNARYYLVFKKMQAYKGFGHSSYIKSTTRDLHALLMEVYSRYYIDKYVEVGVYSISKEDADKLLAKYKMKMRSAVSKDLICTSTDDFLRYVSECPSAERIDLTGYRIGDAKIL